MGLDHKRIENAHEKIKLAEQYGVNKPYRRTREGSNYVTSWAGNKIKPKRLHGGRFEVSHTSASGWHVFDHHSNAVATDGHKNIDEATEHAKHLAKHYGPLPSQHDEDQQFSESYDSAQDPFANLPATLQVAGPVLHAPLPPMRTVEEEDDDKQFAEKADKFKEAPSNFKLEEGHRVRVTYGEHKGLVGTVDHLAPSGNFAGVRRGKKFLGYHHASDLHVHSDHLDSQHSEEDGEQFAELHYHGHFGIKHSKHEEQKLRSLIEKHGGENYRGGFSVPTANVNKFHRAATSTGFKEGHNYKKMPGKGIPFKHLTNED